jgi:hypothetical protein
LTASPDTGRMIGMDILETFRADVKAKRGRLAEVAAATGIKRKALQNILYGQTVEPGYQKVEKLRAFYGQNRRETD